MTPKPKRTIRKAVVAKPTNKDTDKQSKGKKNKKTTNLAGEIGILGWLVVAGVIIYLGWLATNLGTGPS